MVKASDLIKKHEEKNQQKKKIYDKVYLAIEKKIIMASNVDVLYCWYQVPEFFVNLPVYNVDKCTKYLKIKLENNGFEVDFFKPNILYVNWLPK